MYPQIALWSWTAATQRLDLNTSWLELLGPKLALREVVAEPDRAAVERAWGRLAGGETDVADVSLRLASRRGAGFRVRIVAFVTERAVDGAPSALRGTIEQHPEHDGRPESAAAVTRAVPGALTDSLTGLPNRSRLHRGAGARGRALSIRQRRRFCGAVPRLRPLQAGQRHDGPRGGR